MGQQTEPHAHRENSLALARLVARMNVPVPVSSRLPVAADMGRTSIDSIVHDGTVESPRRAPGRHGDVGHDGRHMTGTNAVVQRKGARAALVVNEKI